MKDCVCFDQDAWFVHNLSVFFFFKIVSRLVWLSLK